MRKWIISIALTALVGASPPSHVARLGQTINVDGPRVRPVRIVEDSRCPMEARCVWAGRVRLLVRVYGGRTKLIKELELGKPVPVFDGQLTLTDVSPPKSIAKPATQAAYRFTLSFQGGL